MLCTFYDEEDCRFHFVYTDKDEIKVRAQKERECPPKVFILGIILGVIAAIVLIGLAILLLWKLLTTISDRREFAKFEKERMMAKWDTVSGGRLFELINWNINLIILLYFAGRESDLQASHVHVQESHVRGQVRSGAIFNAGIYCTVLYSPIFGHSCHRNAIIIEWRSSGVEDEAGDVICSRFERE